ncbi:DUF3990 domain-containing protein [Rhizobium sp. Leaf453]|uniref:DUF3990 domain-containing protein n=1 Tax=Rhizobium sp. Leaf453 TaxID=1736380 RepID=UPI0007132E00|nr:DUF3990 domain-containing protein [Rhizobium sp. Leaf453]KQU08039.1 hypothetical protein ASG68_23570 [Rhizobium sp. Leaf453]
MVWTNKTHVFHGTLDIHTTSVAKSPDPKRGRSAADFGKGFYVTSSFHQAKQWANQKARTSTARGLVLKAAVVQFEMNWDWPSNPAIDVLSFVLDDKPFHDFVVFNRLGSTNHKRNGKHAFDVVVGPVAAFPQTLTYANCDQICFAQSGKNVADALKQLRYLTTTVASSLF